MKPEDYEINEKDRNVSLTEIGEVHVEELLGTDPARPGPPGRHHPRTGAPDWATWNRHCAPSSFIRRNKDYLVQGGKVVIVDEFTGRLMPGRRWSDGLHQAVEAKEGVKVEAGECHLRHHHPAELLPHV